MNDWNAIRAFYRRNNAAILAEERCEWGIDAYSWDTGMIRMTPIEAFLWADIRECNAVFYPQYPIGRFFVDFANPGAKVVIECDGAAYHLDKEKDAERDRLLNNGGWMVYRLTGSDCVTDSDPNTGAPGRAMRMVREIVERHRISRNHISRDWKMVHVGKQPRYV